MVEGQGGSPSRAEQEFFERELQRLRAREEEQARTEAALREEAAYVRLHQRVARSETRVGK